MIRRTPFIVSCRGGCHDDQIGITRFHVLRNALAVACFDNRRAGCKVSRVAVVRGHFEITEY